jgi:hypothetical protein
MTTNLLCAACLYDENRATAAQPAVTIIEGYAVCDDHLWVVATGELFASIVNAMRDADDD